MRSKLRCAWIFALLVAGSPMGRVALAAPDQPSGAHADIAVPSLAMPLETYKLDNGLEVILHEDHRTPIVAVNLWYHVGSKDEPAGRNGFAHLFEHLMFQGSKHVGEDMFFQYLERVGASEHNGTTSDDRTNYFETVPSDELALALWLESDRMGFLLDHVNEQTFARQREVVKNERRQNYDNAPYGLVYKYIREALYPAEHPYHRLTIGSHEDLDAATLDDVKAFFRTFYVPNNATLVVAGDIDKETTRKLVARYFGSLPRGATPPVKKGPVPVSLTATKVLDVEAEVELPRVSISWPTPPLFAKGDAELDILGQVLASGTSSRLHKRLVYDMQIAQGVGAYQASHELSSQFEIVVMLKPGQDTKRALAIVDEELDRVRQTAPTEQEIVRAKASIVSHMVFDMARVGSRANAFNQYHQTAGDPRYFDRDVARYTGVTAQTVRAATSFLPAERRVVTFVRPVRGAPRAGRLVGQPAPAQTGASSGTGAPSAPKGAPAEKSPTRSGGAQ